MKVGVCDDNARDRNKVVHWLMTYRREIRAMDILQFSSGESLLDYLRRGSLDILFLDCRMNGKDGIATAREIKKRNMKMTIIALTDFTDYAIYGYDVGIFRYILKEQFSYKISEAFKSAVRYVNEYSSKTCTIKTGNGFVQLPIPEISYIESALRKKCAVMHDNRRYEFYARISDIDVWLKKHGFVRIHKGYLVNSQYIIRFHPNEIEIIGGIKLPVSRGYYKIAYDAFTVFSTEITL